VTSYLADSLVDGEFFLRLLQFLSFLRNLKGSKHFLKDQVYYVITFPVRDFLRFKGVQKRNQYQLTKAVNFLRSLQDLKPLQNFSDTSFRSWVIFPYLKLDHKPGRPWIVEIGIAEELYFYNYPFFFPDCFLNYRGKYDLQVKLELIRVMGTLSLKKLFPIESFLEDLVNQSSLSNRDLTQVKKTIINLVSMLKESKSIESQLTLIPKNGSLIETNELTPLLLTKSRYIYFYEREPSFFLEK